MRQIPKPQELYRHFKGNLYQILTIAQDSETEEKLVIYQALYGDFKVYARKLEMFLSPVDRVKYPSAAQEYRFEKVELESVAKENPIQEVQAQTPEPKLETWAQPKTEPKPAETSSEEADLDPLLVEFLDADGYEAKLNAMTALHHRITQDMITIMAVASDVEVAEGDLEERYEQLRNCLLMLDKYETNRLR
ncbi:MAG: DUF1653 domain-containing protein [Lachnospiraceae bacterium]|nr:DUF1653 domain-containing protein [Lachnospiraceae bacterium]